MKSFYRWVIVACGALMTCVGIGAMFSLAIYLQPMSVDTGWSRTGISSAMTLDFLVMGAAGFGWGALSDRFGPASVVLMRRGAARAWSCAGERGDFAAAVPAHLRIDGGARGRRLLCADDRHRYRPGLTDNRSLAVSLVSAGMGVAPMTISPFARWLVSTYDWRTAMMTIGIGAWALLIPAALLVRRPPVAAAGTRVRPGGRRARDFRR